VLSDDPLQHAAGVESGTGKCLDVGTLTPQGVAECSYKQCKYTPDSGANYACVTVSAD